MSNDIVILSAVRTPIGGFGGSLAGLSAVELGTAAAKAAIERAGITPAQVEETIFGHGRQAGSGTNSGRQVSIHSGIPDTTPAYTVNKACASSLKAIALGYAAIRMGDAKIVLAGGHESMSNNPFLLTDVRWGHKLGHTELHDGNYKDGFFCPLTQQLMGATAETLADQHKITRKEQDEYALRSQQRAGAAQQAGRFKDEIAGIEVKVRKDMKLVDFDEHVRADSTLEKLAKLPPVFRKDGTVHAGNSSGITDGGAALVLADADTAKKLGGTPLVKIVDYATAGVDPAIMGIGPVPALQKLFEKTGLTLKDIDLIELNEAFAAQVLACHREMKFDMDRVNVNGGAIALGHPIGATGARISVTLIHEMKRRGARYGVATLCVSGGMGMAVLYENIK